jgi:hypothetical protein
VRIYAGRGFNRIVIRSCAKKVALAAALSCAPESFMGRLIPIALFCALIKTEIRGVNVRAGILLTRKASKCRKGGQVELRIRAAMFLFLVKKGIRLKYSPKL